jgi:hypothetical protein
MYHPPTHKNKMEQSKPIYYRILKVTSELARVVALSADDERFYKDEVRLTEKVFPCYDDARLHALLVLKVNVTPRASTLAAQTCTTSTGKPLDTGRKSKSKS